MEKKRLGRGLGALLDFEEDKNFIQKINISKIFPSETQPRKFFDDSSINELADLSKELKDRATYNFLQWFIDKQVEEEQNDIEIIDKLKLIGNSKNGGLFMLDKDLSQKTYIPFYLRR